MTQEYLTKKLSSKAGVQVQSKGVDLNKIQVEKTKGCFCLKRLLAFLKKKIYNKITNNR